MKNITMVNKITMVAMWLGTTTSSWKDHLPSVHPVSWIVFTFIEERNNWVSTVINIGMVWIKHIHPQEALTVCTVIVMHSIGVNR